MPNRILKESICTSEDINALSAFEETVFYRLIVSCDDFGRFDGRAAVIRGRLFPLKSVTDKQIEDAIHRLGTVGMVKRYEVAGKPYIQLTAWDQHQRIRARNSKFPAPDETPPDGESWPLAGDSKCQQMSANDSGCQQMSANDSKCPPYSYSYSDANTKTKTKKKESMRFAPPTVEEVSAYCRERGNAVNPQRFVDFYAAKGWMIGKNKMRDWKAAVRSWEQREQPSDTPRTGSFLEILGAIDG